MYLVCAVCMYVYVCMGSHGGLSTTCRELVPSFYHLGPEE